MKKNILLISLFLFLPLVLAAVEDNLVLYLPFNGTLTDYGLDNLTANFTAPDYCFQENASAVSSCGGLSTGSYNLDMAQVANPTYAIDDDWGNFAYEPTGGTYAYLFVNYSKPSNTEGALWQIKFDSDAGIDNYTIPQSCWDYNSSQIELQIAFDYSTADDYVKCNNGTWITIFTTTGSESRVYDEAVYWNISKSVNYTLDKNNVSNSSLFLNGVDEYIMFNDNTNLDAIGSGNYSYSLWVYSNISTLGVISTKYNTSQYPIHLYTNGGYISFEATNGTNININTTITNNAWNNYVFVRDISNNNISLYVNGVYLKSVTENLGDISTISDLSLGNLGATLSWWWKGSLDEFRIYNRTLSSNEVAELYYYYDFAVEENVTIPMCDIGDNSTADNCYCPNTAYKDEGGLCVMIVGGSSNNKEVGEDLQSSSQDDDFWLDAGSLIVNHPWAFFIVFIALISVLRTQSKRW